LGFLFLTVVKMVVNIFSGLQVLMILAEELDVVLLQLFQVKPHPVGSIHLVVPVPARDNAVEGELAFALAGGVPDAPLAQYNNPKGALKLGL
jgi:hypothetical protein